MAILSIQSSVAYGHVGNSAAVFPLQRLGLEVWPVNTVQFSNHTGYGDWRGPVLSAEDVRSIIGGIADRGVLGQVEAVLSGYQGAEDVGAVVLDTVRDVRRLNPAVRYCCDPVMGDVGRGMFVRPGIPEFLRDRLVPLADVITPNHFELDYLAGRATRSRASLLESVDAVRGTGPDTVLVTSVHTDETEPGTLDLVAVSAEGAWVTTTPLLDLAPNGCGDLTAALFLAHLLRTGSAATALERVSASVFAVLQATLAAGTREIALIAAQDAIVTPPGRFEAVRLR